MNLGFIDFLSACYGDSYGNSRFELWCHKQRKMWHVMKAKQESARFVLVVWHVQQRHYCFFLITTKIDIELFRIMNPTPERLILKEIVPV